MQSLIFCKMAVKALHCVLMLREVSQFALIMTYFFLGYYYYYCCVTESFPRGNTVDSYSRDARFEARPEHRLFSLRFFVIFLNPSRQRPGQYTY
jgi:hypothetical protein